MATRKERRAVPRVSKSNDMTRTRAQANVSPDEMKRLIEEAAYFRAKARGFAPGHELEDWIQAEAEVARRLESRQ